MTKLEKFGFIILVSASFSQAVDYRELSRWTSGSCPPRDNCRLIGDKSFAERNCECDQFCSAFQDCCIDAPDSPLWRIFRSRSTTCMPYGNESSVGAYVVGNCPANYAGPKKVKDFCEGHDDFEDPFFSTPVTDVLANVTFRNRYCVECNRAVTPSLKSWFISIKFENLPTHYPSEEFVWKHLEFIPLLKKWGIRTSRRFYPSVFIFHKPDNITSIRQCRLNLISSCPPDFTRVGLKKTCELYTSVVYSGERAYRNIQCAVCNGENPRHLSCTKSQKNNEIENDPFPSLSHPFEMIVDFNLTKNAEENTTENCETGSVMDYFLKKCRRIECALPNYTFNNGKCKKN
ncbi:SMB domain-containing protein [Nephila pilipes]|uniref:SMB domain-containing protein n=1 Tax=Nephila pilipes TaxID=299642 RepID=A0A8X6R8Z3_NEPPI|nr:SMB domain-containing protein [Nephila pilipes]